MQLLHIKRVLYVAAVVMVGGQIGQAMAADTVALLQNGAGNEAHREQHDSTTDSATNTSKVARAFFGVKWHTYSSTNTIQLRGSTDARPQRDSIIDSLKKIMRPLHLSTVFSVPVELDVFGVAKHPKSKAITIHPKVKSKAFKLSVSCPL